jgi:TonB-dependent SusC/RagA subfamily outer membrane receptor
MINGLKKRKMKTHLNISGFIVVLVLMAAPLTGQTRVVHGSLTAFGEYPVENIEVRSKKGKAATLSDSLGHFALVCMEEDVIQIRPKTFKKVNKKVTPGTDSVTINLEFINTPRNRDVAVGYGYVKERDLTAAISQLEQENNEFCHYKDIFDVIVGRFAGVTVENGQVIIRGRQTFYGSDEALYVVDGMVVNSINWIPPCDIKTINIIKDGSAATYGSRGANGVVIIETKRAE